MSVDSLFQSAEENEVTEINLTPLIDIVFLLLIFFMVTSQFEKTTKIPIKKVKAGQQTVDLSQDIKVLIDDNGVLFYQDKKYTTQELISQILLLLQQNPEKKVLLIPDKRGNIEPFVVLLSLFQKKGITAIGIGTEKDNL